MNIARRALHIFTAIDQAVLSIITLGSAYPDETISSWAYRADRDGKFWGKFWRPFIDWLLLPLEKDHCYQSYLAEKQRKQLPVEFR